MKQYIKFLKFLWVILIVPSLYGMENLAPNNNKRPYSLSEVKIEDQEASSKKAKVNKNSHELRYGSVIDLNECPNFVEIIKQSFGINKDITKDEALSLVKEAKDVLKANGADTNLLFCNGDAFINGLMNVTHDFDDFVVGGKRYKARQLCEEFGVSVEEIDAMNDVVRVFSELKRILNRRKAYNKMKSLIGSFWNETKNLKNNTEISKVLQNYQEDPYISSWHREKLLSESEYIKSLNVLKVDMSTLSFGRKGFFESFKIVKEIIIEKTNHLLEQFGEYIGFFNLNDGKDKKEFLEKFEELKATNPINYIQCAEDLCSKYTRYTHTECIVEYLYRDQLEPLNMVTVRDPCKFCEQMAAKITPEQPNRYSVIISGQKYRKDCKACKNKKRLGNVNIVMDPKCKSCEDSRDEDRSDGQTNHSLRLIQLNLESSLKN